MATSQVSNVIQQLHKAMLVQGAPDGQLLESFVNRREAAALEALVRRHGPMVWNVCRRVLRNQQDAEDAFQATFLVFVRKAAFIVPREMVGNWLYGVAHQTALKANATAAKRRRREKQVTQMPEATMTEQEHWTDLQPVLDQEISRLPDNYRVVIVLCDLEGKTRSQAAQQLGWPDGTVAGRLARARTTLAKRLVQRGIVLSGGALAAVLSQHSASACVPAAVVTTTIQTATLVAIGQAAAAIPAKVAALTEGVVKAMLITKLKTGAFVLLMLGILTFTCGMLAYGMTNADGDGVDKAAVKANEKPKDAEGDNENAWHRLKKGELLAVDVERSLYEVKGEKRFLMAVRLTNLTKGEIGADWQAPRTCLSPNQWGVHDTMQREIVSERRAVHASPDQDKVRADFQAGRLLRIPAGKSTFVWTEFNNSGRADVDGKQGKYLIVSMDGQFCATDGATVDTISCAWKKGVGPKETDVVMPFPVKWQTKQDDAKPKAAEGKKENTLTVTIKPQQNRIRAKDAFKVDLRVVNSSKTTQSFQAMSCSWDGDWKSSNDRVSWEKWECGKNVEYTVKLEPGEAYEKTLPMLLVAGKPQEKVSFKLGFTPMGTKQMFWSNEVTVQVDQDKKEPRFVPIASYASQDRAAEKRIRELFDAAKITFISVGSRGLTASVADDKAKQARAILEKAVKDGTLSVTVLDQLPVPKNLKAVRTDDKLRIEEDSNEEVIVSVAAGLIRATDCELSIYRGKERVSHTGGTYTPPFDLTRAASKIPQPGESYELELIVKWFETHAPIRPNWKPQSGGKYKVLVTRTLKLSVGPENTKPAPPNRWEKLLQDKKLTAKQRAVYEQVAKLHTLKFESEDFGAISIPSFVENSKLPTDLLYQMGLDTLPMLAEALDDETPTAARNPT